MEGNKDDCQRDLGCHSSFYTRQIARDRLKSAGTGCVGVLDLGAPVAERDYQPH